MRTVKLLHSQGVPYANGADERPMEAKHGVNRQNCDLVGFTGGPNGKHPGLCRILGTTEYLPVYADSTDKTSALQDKLRTERRRARWGARHQKRIGHPTPMATPTTEASAASEHPNHVARFKISGFGFDVIEVCLTKLSLLLTGCAIGT